MADTYEQAFRDWKYLWNAYGPANDMTGGYVDQEDLARLLRSPTKATAKFCLERQIHYWFDVGPERGGPRPDRSDATLRKIAERYGKTLPA